MRNSVTKNVTALRLYFQFLLPQRKVTTKLFL